MADLNGPNDDFFLATRLGVLSFDTYPGEPEIVNELDIEDSTGALLFASRITQTTGPDAIDYFTFAASGIDEVLVTLNVTQQGDYATYIFATPEEGVSAVRGDFHGTWFGGIHENGASPVGNAIVVTGNETAQVFPLILDLAAINSTDATLAQDAEGPISAVYQLSGGKATISVVAFQVEGNQNPNFGGTLFFDETPYTITITPLSRSYSDLGGDSRQFTDASTFAETHIGGAAIDFYSIAARHDQVEITPLADNAVSIVRAGEPASILADTLIDIERIEFRDGTLAFDTDGKAGQVYRLYQAAFDREPDAEGLGFWIDVFDRDAVDLLAMSQEFIESDEFTLRYGANTELTDEAYLTALYNNVLDRDPDQASFNFWSDQQAQGISRADIMLYFSGSVENVGNVAAAISDRIFYT
ncbi:MAG: DUF4214 domain-containing protein [Sulfitobacter sp.]